MNYFEQAVNTLDSIVFSSDLLENSANREMLKEHCERWFRTLAQRSPISAGEAASRFSPYVDFNLGSEMRVVDGYFTDTELMQLAFVAYQVKDE